MSTVSTSIAACGKPEAPEAPQGTEHLDMLAFDAAPEPGGAAGPASISEAVAVLAEEHAAPSATPQQGSPSTAREPGSPSAAAEAPRNLKTEHASRRLLVPISSLVPGKYPRDGVLDVADLVESLRHTPLLQRPDVRPLGDAPDKFEIILGHRRVEAFRQLARSEIEVDVYDDVDDATVELFALEENLRRKPLADENTAAARAKELYLALGAPQRASDCPPKAGVSSGHGGRLVKSAAAKVADSMNASMRSASRKVKIGKHGTPELKQALEAEQITINEAEKLAGRPPEQQRQELPALLARKAAADVPVELRRAQEALLQVARAIKKFCEQHAESGRLKPEIVQVLKDRANVVVQAVTALEAASAASAPAPTAPATEVKS